MIRDARNRLLLLFLTTSIGISILLLPFTSTTPTYAHATGDPITVDSRNSTLQFPKSINFEVKAHDDQATLTQATLYIKYNYTLSFSPQQSVSAPTQERSATFSWQDDLTRNARTFPQVGTQVSYYWIIQDSNGNAHTDSIQTFEVTDNRFQWQHVSQGPYQINWYNQQNNFGQAILTKVTTASQSISNNLGAEPQKQINLWVYGSEEDFKGSLPPNTYEWVGGIAYPATNQASIVVQSLTDTTLSRDMVHELTHLIFHQLTLPGTAPTWFDEGMAVYNQYYHESEMQVRFKNAVTTHSLLTLSSISRSFPADADAAYLAYAESWQLLDYMYKTFGQSKMHTLIRAMDSHTYTFDGDLQQAIGLDMAHLENQWYQSLGQPTTPLPTQQPQNPLGPISTAPINTSNTTTQLMTLLGIGLIFIPLLGFGALLAYQRRRKYKASTPQQGQLPPHAPPHAPFPNQNMPWYPPMHPPTPYAQPPQPLHPTPNVHAANYTSPEAYTAPITPGAPPPYNTPQIPQNQPYGWYPPHPQYPQGWHGPQHPPYPQQPGNPSAPRPPQAPQE